MIIVSWIFVGFLSWLFLLLSTLRKSEYNKEDLKDYFNVRDLDRAHVYADGFHL